MGFCKGLKSGIFFGGELHGEAVSIETTRPTEHYDMIQNSLKVTLPFGNYVPKGLKTPLLDLQITGSNRPEVTEKFLNFLDMKSRRPSDNDVWS